MRTTVSVVALPSSAVVFPFGDPPHVKVGVTRYGHRINVDPTPAYAHSARLVRACLSHVSSAFPIDWPVSISLLPVESLGRTNGATFVDFEPDYDATRDKDGKLPGQIHGTIYFEAKRIPIHPAMTRYLVAHEYGHVVEEWLNARREGQSLYSGALVREYAEMRGMKMLSDYGAGLWHRTPGEVFANDFRVVVCGAEAEFWPHPTVEHPQNLQRVSDWWAQHQRV